MSLKTAPMLPRRQRRFSEFKATPRKYVCGLRRRKLRILRFALWGAKAQSLRCARRKSPWGTPPYPTKPADAGLWRGPQDLFHQKCVCKTLKYTKYSCGFTPFSDEKSLVRLSCRFMRYCLSFSSSRSGFPRAGVLFINFSQKFKVSLSLSTVSVV